jgi:hypothetical protein
MRQGTKRIARGAGRACGRAGAIAAHAIAFTTAILFSLAIVLLYVLSSSSGLSLNLFRPAIERIAAVQSGAEHVSIGSISLVRDRVGDAPLRVVLDDVVLDRGASGEVAVPGVSIRLSMANLLRGEAMPRFVDVRGAQLSVERSAGDLAVGGTLEGSAAIDFGALIEQARSAGFEGAVFEQLSLDYVNRDTGARFSSAGGRAVLSRGERGYDFKMIVPYGSAKAGSELRLDFTSDDAAETYSAILTARDAPADAIVPLLLRTQQELAFDGTVTGELQAFGTFTGGFSAIELDLQLQGGDMSIGPRRIPVNSIAVEGVLAPELGRVTLDRLEYAIAENTGVFRGLANGLANADGTISFDLAGSAVTVALPGLLPERLPLSQVAVAGAFDFSERTLTIDYVGADFFDARLVGSAAIGLAAEDGGTPAVATDLVIEGVVSPEQILRAWPLQAADGARQWVSENLHEGSIYDVAYRMDLPSDLTRANEISGDMIDLSFKARNVSLTYVPGMPPLEDLSATARISGNSFSLDATGGRIDHVTVREGSIRMNQLVPKGAPAVFTVTFAGALEDILDVLDEPPLGYMTKAGLSPDQFSGDGQFTLEIVRPMLSSVPQSDYGFSGSGTFGDLSIDLAPPLLPVSNGAGSVRLNKEGLSISGTVDIEEVPATFHWTRFFERNGAVELRASAPIDTRAADALGLPFRRFVNGVIDLEIKARGSMNRFNRFDVAADFTQAALTSDERTYVKERGEPGEVRASVALAGPDAPLVVESLLIDLGAANMEGSARVTRQGALLELDLPRFFIEDIADLSCRVSRTGEDLRIAVSGAYLNAEPLVDRLFGRRPAGGSALPGDVALDVVLGTVELKGDVELHDVVVNGEWGSFATSWLRAGANLDGGALNVELADSEAGIGQDVRLSTNDFGQVLRGLFGITSVLGGDATFEATFIDNGPVAGQIFAEEIVIQNAPTIATLLSLGSLDGLENALNGEGLEFAELRGDVQLHDGVLRLVNARLTGSALGLSANGIADLGDRRFDINGAVAPAYRMNSLLGELPGLGDLLVSREGEGVVAFAYQLEGPIAEPTVSVNTLAALTPGIFRRIFEPVREVPSTQALLDAAEASAGTAEARDFLSTPELLKEYESHRATPDIR